MGALAQRTADGATRQGAELRTGVTVTEVVRDGRAFRVNGEAVRCRRAGEPGGCQCPPARAVAARHGDGAGRDPCRRRRDGHARCARRRLARPSRVRSAATWCPNRCSDWSPPRRSVPRSGRTGRRPITSCCASRSAATASPCSTSPTSNCSRQRSTTSGMHLGLTLQPTAHQGHTLERRVPAVPPAPRRGGRRHRGRPAPWPGRGRRQLPRHRRAGVHQLRAEGGRDADRLLRRGGTMST